MGLRSNLASLVLAGCSFISGCKVSFPTPKPEKWDFYPGAAVRVGGDIVIYRADIPKSLQTDSVGTATKLENELSPGIRPYIGLEGFLGWKNTKIRVAVDGQYNPYATSGYRDGIFDVKREPISGESYAFSQLELKEITYMPSIGIESTFFDKLVAGFEVGLPYNEFTFKSGRDTYGSWKTEKKDSDAVFGTRYAGKLLYKIDFDRGDYGFVGVDFGYETYSPKFLKEKSEIEAFTTAIVWEARF